MSIEKENIGHLPTGAKIYVASISGIALAVLLYCVATWKAVNLGQFLLYLVCGVYCCNTKVILPGITGTLSVNYLFILASATGLPRQTVAVGCTSGVARLFWAARKRPRNVPILFVWMPSLVDWQIAAGNDFCCTGSTRVHHYRFATSR
jgi:hypothetical protein